MSLHDDNAVGKLLPQCFPRALCAYERAGVKNFTKKIVRQKSRVDHTLTGECMIRATGRPQISLIHFFLTGEIPVSLGNCFNLMEVDLGDNKLEGKCTCSAHTTILPDNLLSKILHTRTFMS